MTFKFLKQFKGKRIYLLWGILSLFILSLVLISYNSQDDITTKAISEEDSAKEEILLEENMFREIFESPVSEETKELYRVTKIIDGDTIEIDTGERVRLICIDTPEKGEYYYSEASNYLTGLILNKEVEFTKDISETDRYGRLLRYVYIGRDFVNELIVYNGYGKDYPYKPDISKCPIIKQAEKYARDNNLGIWGEKIDEQEEQEEAIEEQEESEETVEGQEEEEEQEESSPSDSEIICSYDAYNCGDFSSCSEVMRVFSACNSDVHRLDRDKDDIPCENLCG
ncbi:MAG: thermonuclease family protein [Nanoarchaeota archaeon]|nr:thermonuclease family protein [Nanoarchaeota archaeon]